MEEKFWLITGTLIFVFPLAKFLVTKKCFTCGMEWPAGPRKLPIIGNLHQLGAGDLFHVWLAKLAKVHGGVFTIWVGSWHPVIIVSDINNAREVLVNKSSSYSARELVDRLKIITADGKTVSESDSSPYWHKLKKGLQNVALTPLNVMSQSHLEEEGMKNLIISMKENASQENGILKPLDYVKEESIRILSRPIFGQDFSNENFVVGMCHILEELSHIGEIVSLADAFKIAEYLPSFKQSMRQLHAVKERIQNLIRPLMVSNPPTNTYLHFLSSQDYSEDLIVCAILEVYLLGVHSTAGTIVWALTFLVCEQKIQEKLYREIKNVIGGTTRPVKVT